jgi:ABC-type antimicrobial peptide transport system permease subunit
MDKHTMPPPLFHRFFRWYCHPKLLDHIEGDLLEVYGERLNNTGKRNADVRFIIDVLLLFRPGIIRPASGHQKINNYGMIKNYFKVATRSLINNKVFSLINISGLSLGLTCSLLISLWVLDEYRVDSFHEDSDRLFAITSCEYSGSEINGSYDTPGVLAEELKKVFPEVEYATGHSWNTFQTFAVGDKKMKLEGNYGSPDFFKMFSFPLLLGTKEGALKTPDCIAISATMATNLFGSPEQAMGKSVLFENYRDLKVTAVFADLKDNTSLKFDYLLNWDFFVERHQWVKQWGNSGPLTYIKLKEHADPQALNTKLQHFLKGYVEGYSDFARLELGLYPFEDQYLHGNFKDGYVSGGRIEYAELFKYVAAFILLIACINFMNLSTARSIKRAKEIGVRKVSGAVRSSLIAQFIIEAFLFTIISVLISIILLLLILPQFNLLTSKNIGLPLGDGEFWIGIGLLTIATAVFSGSYPAFLLSSFKPISVLKNNIKTSASSFFLRKGLVVFQFALSMIFIVGMVVISRQVDYIQNKNLGYQRNNLVFLRLEGAISNNFDLFKNEALGIPGITTVSYASHRPIGIDHATGSVEWEGKLPGTRPTFRAAAVGYDFIKTVEATMLYGRDFSMDHADSTSYIINETALRVIAYKDPIGMPLTFADKKGTIIGVVKDFHFNSFHEPIAPLVIRLNKGKAWGYALLRVEPDKMTTALTELEELHNKMNPDLVFAHEFADAEYAYLYRSEQVIRKLSGYFAFLATFISSIGLLGLVMFTAEQRTKEVGVRKVLGASVVQIVTLLSKDFMKLVVISIILSSPIAWYVMNDWLSGFEYHIAIQWWIFAASAAGAVLIALLTVSIHAVKAASANPVHSLRSE